MEIQIQSESDLEAGWRFAAVVGERKIDFTLSWADYNHWSPDGRDEPAHVARVVLVTMAERGAEHVPLRFDASMVRRVLDGADQQIRDKLR